MEAATRPSPKAKPISLERISDLLCDPSHVQTSAESVLRKTRAELPRSGYAQASGREHSSLIAITKSYCPARPKGWAGASIDLEGSLVASAIAQVPDAVAKQRRRPETPPAPTVSAYKREGGMLVDIGVGASFVIVISAMLTVVFLK